ncbi:MAG: A/G-specific adenine glycosylase [Campylobacterales bacterium]|nr:A/G-specific adenine glycosylase [Campylobacterales bacterium]
MKKAYKLFYKWYEKNGRHDLPWRLSSDPYRIWVSEIMLQQTQVKTVLARFYFPFLKAFPSLETLANASEDEVLKMWEGLGYYTRARNLHKSAKLCASVLPQSVHELTALPGIGRSTAHAIAAFAYKTPLPIMDANVKRILCRFYGLKKAGEKLLWEKAYDFFDAEHPYDFNQAIMDLGASVCMAKAALCHECPFASLCMAVDDPLAYPQKKVKKSTPVRRKQIVIHRHQGRFALKQRDTRFLNGLWGFSEYEQSDAITTTQKLGEIVQVYSHFRLEAEVYLRQAHIEEHEWFTLEEINKLALSRADHKALALLDMSEK